MISLDAQRLAHQRQQRTWIAAWPSKCRYLRTQADLPIELDVRTSEPKKARELKQGGFQLAIDLEVQIVLPDTEPAPQPEKTRLEILDQGGEYKSYDVKLVTPLRGRGCYQLGLRSRNNVPTRSRPPSPYLQP